MHISEIAVGKFRFVQFWPETWAATNENRKMIISLFMAIEFFEFDQWLFDYAIRLLFVLGILG